MFQGLSNLASLMKNAQQIQGRAQEMKDRLASVRVEGSAGGGRQPGDRVIIVLPFEQALAEISTSWTVRNTRTGRRYNVLRADDTERHDRWIYLLCEYGKEGSNV